MKLNLENCSCIVSESKNRKLHELNYLLSRATIDDVGRSLAEEGIHVSSVIIKIHMERHIPMEVMEELVDYLPSITSSCAQMLSKVKSRAITFLDMSVLEDKDIKLLGILVKETSSLLDKLGQATGEADSVHSTSLTIAPSNFEEAAMMVLPDFPDCFIQIKAKMAKMEK